MTKELTPQQEHQRKVWDEARTCKPVKPLSDEEVAANKARSDEIQAEINALLGLLNESVDGKPRTSISIVIGGEVKEFNTGAVESALRAQNFGWSNTWEREGPNVRLDVDGHLFPGIDFQEADTKIIKKVYSFDCTARKAMLVITRCDPLPNGDTWGTPRYEKTYESVTGFDNIHWRGIINDVIAPFGRCGFVHLYNHDFKFVWDHEACLSTIHPKQDDGTYAM